MNDLERYGRIYKKEINEWIKLGLLDKQVLKKAYRSNVIKKDVNEWRFYREVFRANVLLDFYKFTHSISDVIDRNPKYREYIQKLDKENNEINLIDRERRILAKKGEKLSRKMENRQKKLLKERPQYSLIAIPRGLLKSTIFQTHRGAWYYLVGAVLQNQAPVIFVLHEDVNKAQDNLNLIKQVLELDYIEFAFSDVLSKNRDRVSEISFDVQSDVMRKESHFMAQSIYKDLGGKHGALFLIDDLQLRDNTQTPAQVQKLMDIFLSWKFIDDHLGRTRFEMAGTARRQNDVYTYIEEELHSCVWREGATTDENMNPTLFDENPRYNFPEVYDEEKVKESFKTFKRSKGMYYSQIEMVPQPFEDDLDIVSGVDYLYHEENLSTRFLCKSGCVVTSKDPSYSVYDKKEGDGKSRDTTITGAIKDGILYVFNAEQLLGGSDETIFAPLQRQVMQFRSDVVVQDAQGTQYNFAVRCDKWLKKNVKHRYIFKYYRRPKQNNAKGKAGRAGRVLAEYFRMGIIKVNSNLNGLIAELERRTTGFDYLDCLLMILNFDFDNLEQFAKNNKEQRKINIVRNSEEVINKTAGY